MQAFLYSRNPWCALGHLEWSRSSSLHFIITYKVHIHVSLELWGTLQSTSVGIWAVRCYMVLSSTAHSNAWNEILTLLVVTVAPSRVPAGQHTSARSACLGHLTAGCLSCGPGREGLSSPHLITQVFGCVKFSAAACLYQSLCFFDSSQKLVW